MRMLGGVRVVLALTAVTAVAASAGAQTWYTSRAAWQAASSGITNVDFSGIAPSPGNVDYADGVSLAIGPVTFTGHYPGSPNAMSVIEPASGDVQYDWGSGAILLGNANYAGASSGYIDAALPAGVRSVGVDVLGYLTDPNFNFAGYGIGVTVSAYDAAHNLIGSQIANTLTRPNLAFLGLTSPVPVVSVVLTPNATARYYAFPGYDNFSYGALAAVPEPATLGLLASGLAALGAMGLSRRRRS